MKVDDLLKYSRVTNGILSFTNIHLYENVLGVLDDPDQLVTSSGAQVEVGELPVLSAEPILFRQLFQTLIGNALKFHEPEKAPVAKIESDDLALQMSKIRVIDQGIVFEELYLHRVFQPFKRLHGVKEYEGSGIDLDIVASSSGGTRAALPPGVSRGSAPRLSLPCRSSKGRSSIGFCDSIVSNNCIHPGRQT